jgi:hypothetical protein
MMPGKSSMLCSDPSQVFIQKYWPLIFFFGVLIIIFWKIGFRWDQLVFLVPFFLLSLFRASLAVVEVENEGIRYRRRSEWRKVSFDEVASCGHSKAGLEIGFFAFVSSVSFCYGEICTSYWMNRLLGEWT